MAYLVPAILVVGALLIGGIVVAFYVTVFLLVGKFLFYLIEGRDGTGGW